MKKLKQLSIISSALPDLLMLMLRFGLFTDTLTIAQPFCYHDTGIELRTAINDPIVTNSQELRLIIDSPSYKHT